MFLTVLPVSGCTLELGTKSKWVDIKAGDNVDNWIKKKEEEQS